MGTVGLCWRMVKQVLVRHTQCKVPARTEVSSTAAPSCSSKESKAIQTTTTKLKSILCRSTWIGCRICFDLTLQKLTSILTRSVWSSPASRPAKYGARRILSKPSLMETSTAWFEQPT
eukprot:PhF_6_TR29383/c2_g1_i1/m.43323